MRSKELKEQTLLAARDQGIANVLFRNAVGRKLGLNITDYECLSFVSIKGAATPTEIAQYTGMTTGSATVMLDRLEKSGLITRRPNPNDRRGVFVEANKKWTKNAGPLVAGVQKAQAELISSYSDDELKTITDFLTRFAKNVKEQTQLIGK